MTTTQIAPGETCPADDHADCDHPEGATLWLGGKAWAHPKTDASLLRPIDAVTNYPGNPRRGDQDEITGSVVDLGFYGTVQAQTSTGYVLVGNHRLRTLQDLDAELAPVEQLAVSDTVAAAIVARDNYTSDRADNDPADMVELLSMLEREGEIHLVGGLADDLEALRAMLTVPAEPLTDPDEIPDPPRNPVTRPGDVWHMGSHRLICGDALDRETYRRLLGTDRPTMVVTSPPYNQKLDGFKPSGMQKESPNWVNRMAGAYGDSLPEDDYQAQQVAMLAILHTVTAPDAALFYNHKHRYRDKRVVSPMQWLTLGPWELRQEIVWNRMGSITLNARMFMPSDERVYWMVKAGDFRFNDTPEIKAWSSVWAIAPRVDVAVSAPFPVEIPRRCILAASGVGDVVLDPYAGSGTTLIACEQESRAAMCIELDPTYADVICRRYQHHTGTKPTRDGKPHDFTVAAT